MTDPRTRADEVAPVDYAAAARRWLAEQLPPRVDASRRSVAVFHDLPFDEERALLGRIQEWLRTRFDAGYGAISWPVEHGGAGLSALHEEALAEVEREFETPGQHELTSVSTELIAPTVQLFGTTGQKERLVRPLLRGDELLATIAEKSFRNGARNPMVWRRKEMAAAEIAATPMISHPLTQYMYCSPGEGAVALVLCRADKAPEYTDAPVFLQGAAFRSKRYGSFEVFSPWTSIDRADSSTVEASAAAFSAAGIAPSEVDVAQVQDTESGAELMHMAEAGLCAHGEQEELITSGATAIGGRLPVNTDGGCIANGEPIGASGLRQVYENVLQLRGDAGGHQVPGDPRVGFTHVYGAPGISACTVLTR